MSGSRKNFITDFIDNIQQEMTKNKEMKVCRSVMLCCYWTSVCDNFSCTLCRLFPFFCSFVLIFLYVKNVYLMKILKNWVIRCWPAYLSGVICKWFACSPNDATVSPSFLLHWNWERFYTFLLSSYFGWPGKRPLNGCCCCIVSVWHRTAWYNEHEMWTSLMRTLRHQLIIIIMPYIYNAVYSLLNNVVSNDLEWPWVHFVCCKLFSAVSYAVM